MKLYARWTSTAAATEFVCKFSNTNKISNEHFNLCEAELSLDEIIKSINSETNNKPPGNDGLTAEFYRYFLNELTPVPLTVYDSLTSLTNFCYKKCFLLVNLLTPSNESVRCRSHQEKDVCGEKHFFAVSFT